MSLKVLIMWNLSLFWFYKDEMYLDKYEIFCSVAYLVWFDEGKDFDPLYRF